jgi:hypothetical protein
MSKKAFEKIEEGLKEAIDVARVKEDDSLTDIAGRTIIYRPIIIVEATDDGKQQYRLHLSELDPHTNEPKMFGIVLSDLLDHIAHAYHGQTGRDARDIRYDILKVLRDEDRFKEKDPARGKLRGATSGPLRS